MRDGVARTLVRRETIADLLARDCCLPRPVPDAGCWDDDAWCGGVVLGRD